MKNPKQKNDSDPYEIGDLVESPTRNLIGEIVSFLGDRSKSIEVIVLDKRLKPLINLEGEFKYKKLPSELIKHFDYSQLRISRGFFLGDVIAKTDSTGNKRFGILVEDPADADVDTAAATTAIGSLERCNRRPSLLRSRRAI
mgnify:CR=1 FL=1